MPTQAGLPGSPRAEAVRGGLGRLQHLPPRASGAAPWEAGGHTGDGGPLPATPLVGTRQPGTLKPTSAPGCGGGLMEGGVWGLAGGPPMNPQSCSKALGRSGAGAVCSPPQKRLVHPPRLPRQAPCPDCRPPRPQPHLTAPSKSWPLPRHQTLPGSPLASSPWTPRDVFTCIARWGGGSQPQAALRHTSLCPSHPAPGPSHVLPGSACSPRAPSSGKPPGLRQDGKHPLLPAPWRPSLRLTASS